MPTTISKFEDQARSYYDESKIKERKAVSYESPAKGFSTVYQWSFISSTEGGLVNPHVHKGFEVLTYVVQGAVEQEKEEGGDWIKVQTGDFSVMASGSGVTHSEKYHPDTKVIQIWLDPDFRRSLQRPSVFRHFEAEDFESVQQEGMEHFDFCDDDAPLWTATKVQLDRYNFQPGAQSLPLAKDQIFSMVVLSGQIEINGDTFVEGDYVQVKDEGQIAFNALEAGAIFTLNCPLEAGYRTYSDQLQLSS